MLRKITRERERERERVTLILVVCCCMILLFFFRVTPVSGGFGVDVLWSGRWFFCFFFYKYCNNFRVSFALEAGEKLSQQAYNNKVGAYCEKIFLSAGDSCIILLQNRFKRKK